MTLMTQIKKRVLQTDLYQRHQAKKDLRQWTSKDQERFVFYSQFISHDSLCFDIGANFGNRVKIFRKLGARVIAVEPQPKCVSILRSFFSTKDQVEILQKALGASEGEAPIWIGSSSTLSSMSPEWIQAVKTSGRFSQFSWGKKIITPMTTLDSLIAQYGIPDFIKMDVEGFEYEVIRGLSQPVRFLSLEFTPEYLESTFKCLDHLERLGEIRLNYAIGESMEWLLEDWITSSDMKKILSNGQNDSQTFGDLYVRFL